MIEEVHRVHLKRCPYLPEEAPWVQREDDAPPDPQTDADDAEDLAEVEEADDVPKTHDGMQDPAPSEDDDQDPVVPPDVNADDRTKRTRKAPKRLGDWVYSIKTSGKIQDLMPRPREALISEACTPIITPWYNRWMPVCAVTGVYILLMGLMFMLIPGRGS